jgi:hypothetical protein
MSSELDHVDAQQARRERMIDEFRAARQRRLVKQGIALWNCTEEAYREAAAQGEPPPTNLK